MILGEAGSYYVATVLMLLLVDVIAAWGFDLQYGTTRVINMSFIASQAAGAYISAVLTIGPATSSSGELYVLGAHLPFPIAWLGGVAAGALLAFALGALLAPRLNDLYFAIVTLVVAIGLLTIVSAYVPLFNGVGGISGVALPLSNGSTAISYFWLLVGIAAVLAAACGWFLNRLHSSPMARRLRAVRDNERTARSIGIQPVRAKITVMVVGGALGGLSGVLLVNAFGAWGTDSWQIAELLVLLTAVVMGGSGNPWGVAVGVLSLMIIVGQGILFIPGLKANGELSANIEAMLVAVAEIAFFWFRPQGVIPERVRRHTLPDAAQEPSPADKDQASALGRLMADGSSAVTGALAGTRVATTGSAPVLDIQGLTVRFGGISAIQDLTVALKPGTTCLVGPNGAGKSTLLASIAGEIRSAAGRIAFEDCPLTGSSSDRAHRGVVRTFQLPQEFASMTVLENVMVAIPDQRGTSVASATLQAGTWRRQDEDLVARACSILELCSLLQTANRIAGTLSGGQKKLLELARALACRPRLILLDEPTAGVAPRLHEAVVAVLRDLKATGVSLVIVSHEMPLVRSLADDVVVMAAGTVLARGSFDRVTQDRAVQDAYLGRDLERKADGSGA